MEFQRQIGQFGLFTVLFLLFVIFIGFLISVLTGNPTSTFQNSRWVALFLTIIISFFTSMGYDARVSSTAHYHRNAQERSHAGPLHSMSTSQSAQLSIIVGGSIVGTVLIFVINAFF